MGNQCPQCQTPINGCTIRDVLKDQFNKRDDLDISHIKKGQYKKIISNEKQYTEVQTKEVVQPIKNKDIKLVNNQAPEVLHADRQVQRTLKFTQSHQLINLKENVLKSKQPMKNRDSPTLNHQEDILKPLTLDYSNQIIQLKKGVIYSGGSIQKQPHEKGKIVWEDKTVLQARFFLGELIENQKVRIQFNDNSIYEGQVKEGRANGFGKVIFSDETYFQGQFKEDMPHGLGKHKMSDGTLYEGMFQNGLKKGKGKYYFQDGMYEGQFYNDVFHGQGIMIFNDGRNIKGVWHEGNLQGKGQMQWQTGQKYIGNFHNYKRQGQGTYYFSDGRQWTGQWKNDRQNGFGCYQSKGELIKSIWANGLKTQQLRQIDLNLN